MSQLRILSEQELGCVAGGDDGDIVVTGKRMTPMEAFAYDNLMGRLYAFDCFGGGGGLLGGGICFAGGDIYGYGGVSVGPWPVDFTTGTASDLSYLEGISVAVNPGGGVSLNNDWSPGATAATDGAPYFSYTYGLNLTQPLREQLQNASDAFYQRFYGQYLGEGANQE